MIGVGIHYDGYGIVPNNSFVTTDISGTITSLSCISETTMPNVGQWLSPTGQDLTTENPSPFTVTLGGQDNPGYLNVQQSDGHIVTVSYHGIYQCIMPSENDVVSYLNVGIYPHNFNSKSWDMQILPMVGI